MKNLPGFLAIAACSILLCVNFFSCQKPQDEILCNNPHNETPCLQEATKTNIRIKNDSQYDFCNLVLTPSSETANYGGIAAGATTCHRPFTKAYDYAKIEVFINNELFIIQPIDFVGETPLGTGNFTYTIAVTSFANRALSITASED